SRSQLPGAVKRLEAFRQRQAQQQAELAAVQTTLALAEAPAEQAAAKEAGNDKTLERAAFLRRVLAEGERAPKPAALAAAKGGGAGGLEIASAEPTGMKKEFSNGDIAQKARDFTAARGGAGAFDAPGKAAKSLAPGDAAVEKNDDASREDAKKDAKGLLNAASPIEAAPSPAAPAAKADAAGNQIAQGKLALAEAPARQGEIMNQAATLDRADYLRRAIVQAKRADKPATAPASAPAKDRAVGGPDIAAIEPPSPTMTNASFAQKAN
ncbi:MAG: hypothetical protein NT031_18190, partial [Planctomycetota bacterium]|nr:hypothetical protein [Planctomycetota bacterium]